VKQNQGIRHDPQWQNLEFLATASSTYHVKRSENLGDEQHFRLRDLLRYNLKTVRAYLLKEAFQQLWDYNSPAWAGRFLDEWCRQTMR